MGGKHIDGHDPVADTPAAIEATKVRPSIADFLPHHNRLRRAEQGRHREGARLAAWRGRGSPWPRKNLGWTSPPFEIPSDILGQWRSAGARGKPLRDAWQQRLAKIDAEKRTEFERRARGELSGKLAAAVRDLKQKLSASPKEIATRSASEFALDALRRWRCRK